MNTQSETILAAIKSLLDGGAIGAPVERSRVLAFQRGDLPAVVVKPAEEESEPLAASLSKNTLTVEIEVHARGDIPDQIADPVVQKVHAAMAADPTLGGCCARLYYRGRKWETADADGSAGHVALSYIVHYATLAADLGRQP